MRNKCERATVKEIAWPSILTALAMGLFLLASLVWFSLEAAINVRNPSASLASTTEHIHTHIIEPIPSLVSQAASFAFVEHGPRTEPAILDEDEHDTAASDSTDFQGIVVFEQSGLSQEQIEELRQSFLDEVDIAFYGGGMGVITIISGERQGDAYRFLLVPVEPSAP